MVDELLTQSPPGDGRQALYIGPETINKLWVKVILNSLALL
jgi:hypothetical protein